MILKDLELSSIILSNGINFTEQTEMILKLKYELIVSERLIEVIDEQYYIKALLLEAIEKSCIKMNWSKRKKNRDK